MESPYNGRTTTQVDTRCWQMKTPVLGMYYCFPSCWPLGSHKSLPRKIMSICSVLGYSSEYDAKTPLLKISYAWDRTWTDRAVWYSPGSFIPIRGLSGCCRGYAHYWRGKLIVNPTQLWTPWSPITTGLKRYVHQCDRGTKVHSMRQNA